MSTSRIWARLDRANVSIQRHNGEDQLLLKAGMADDRCVSIEIEIKHSPLLLMSP